MKNNKGITLITLIVTIIVLLILSAVTINSIVGENGIISRARESQIVTAIADTMFDLESNIVDINIDRIATTPKYTATEMMIELTKRGLLAENEDSFLTGSSSNLLVQSDIKRTTLKGLSLGYNGDLWFENYKRGKIQLSQQTETIYSNDKKTKIVVIDGTIERLEQIDDKTYMLHSLKDRNDFACWVNQYGEIVSQYSDTIVRVDIPRNEEFVAIYNRELRYQFLKNSGAFLGVQALLENTSDSTYKVEYQITYCYDSHFLQGFFDKPIVETCYHQGVYVNGMGIVISDNYEDLIEDKNIDGHTALFPDNKLVRHNNYLEDVPDKYGPYTVDQNFKFYPTVTTLEGFTCTSAYVADTYDVSKYIEECKAKGIKRLYYRGLVVMCLRNAIGISNPSDPFRWEENIGEDFLNNEEEISEILNEKLNEEINEEIDGEVNGETNEENSEQNSETNSKKTYFYLGSSIKYIDL